MNTETLHPSERTETNKRLKMPIEEQIAYSASDYVAGLERPAFAESWGGIDALRGELIKLVKEWQDKQNRKADLDVMRAEKTPRDRSRDRSIRQAPEKTPGDGFVLPITRGPDGCLGVKIG